MPRTEQVNELLKTIIGNAIARLIEIDNTLITTTFVDISPDLKNAKIGISVIPKNFTGTALSKLRENTSLIAREINKQSKLRRTPKITWTIDDTESRLASIEESFKKISKEK